ncbi:hypothetical protein FBPa5_0052 [Pseudomonas phage vB_PaeM_FBPa5]|nr:hypothetical protein FBPa5_0052 [Pseudomonas phage vB_PaeM_FBPa5]
MSWPIAPLSSNIPTGIEGCFDPGPITGGYPKSLFYPPVYLGNIPPGVPQIKWGWPIPRGIAPSPSLGYHKASPGVNPLRYRSSGGP